MDYNYETLLVDQQDSVLTMTLNRPETLNAVNGVMSGELEDFFGRVGRDADVNTVVLTGAGRGFCSGGDIKAMDERGGAMATPQRSMGAVSQSARHLIQNILFVDFLWCYPVRTILCSQVFLRGIRYQIITTHELDPFEVGKQMGRHPDHRKMEDAVIYDAEKSQVYP